MENKTRPIKVIFTDETSKWEFLKRVNEAFKKSEILCLLDRPKEVRDAEFKLRQSVKTMTAKHSDVHFRSRNMKIQAKNNQGEWINLKQEVSGEWIFPMTA